MASRRQTGWDVPGFGLPLRWPRTNDVRSSHQQSILLASGLDGSEDPRYCYTSRELTMLAWINELTDLPHWHRQIFDNKFGFEWKSRKVLAEYDATRAMADYCVDEVRYYVQSDGSRRGVPTIDGGVLKSDSTIDIALKKELQQAMEELRNDFKCQAVSTEGRLAVDIVDPYLFPFAWDRTRTLRTSSIEPLDCITRCCQGSPVKAPPADQCEETEYINYRNEMAWSNRFQWLPFDLTFDEVDTPRISSYINNVHPIKASRLYAVVEKLINVLIPHFNTTLVDTKAPGYQNSRIHLVDFGAKKFIDRDPREPFRPPEQRAYAEFLGGSGLYRKDIFVDLKREFWNVGLQMVLHAQDIDLTPADPEFKGEEWHIQGQNNERVCATATYIYSMNNISSTKNPAISFRRRIFPEEAIAAKGEIRTPPFLPQIYGAKDGDPIIQCLGQVDLREGRAVTWPNTFQTRLSSFTLDDPSKPGHLRMLTLHLIDPNRRLMSTAMVPCQRRDWWAQSIRFACPALWRLPPEIFEHVVAYVDEYPITLEEGKRTRDEFKALRETYREKHTQAMEGYEEWDFEGEPGTESADEE